MNNGIKCLFIFSLGAAVGTAVSWKILESKYKKIADDEIADVKDRFYQRLKSYQSTTTLPKDVDELHEVEDDTYEQAIQAMAKYDRSTGQETKASINKNVDMPYVISPEEFADLNDYETVSLTYFADGVLADDDLDEIEDVEDIVGSDFFEHFGEYEDDSVFIRNDKLRCDYEILRDLRNYTDVISGR